MKKRLVSMKDVAKAADVHQTTVSLAFRNSPKIPRETKERIFEIAARIGYRRNPLVSALMANRIQASHSPNDVKVGYVTAVPNGKKWLKYNPLLPDYFEPAAARFQELGYRMERLDFSSDEMSIGRFFNILLSRSIHGLIIAPMPETVHLPDVDLSQTCIVSLGRRSVFDGIHRVARHHGQVMRAAMDACIEYGYKHVGLCLVMSRQWEGVWEDYLGSYLIRNRSDSGGSGLVIPPFLSCEMNPARILEWVRGNRIDVVITNKAKQVKQIFGEAGMRVPEDIGIVSIDETLVSDEFAGFEHDYMKIAEAAATLLSDMLTRFEFGIPESQTELLVVANWKNGQSIRKQN